MKPQPGQIVILNGVPRSGKSSIVTVIQERFDGPWMNLGVDVHARHVTPPRYRPGIGLRPGGERPGLETLVPILYAALYESIAAHSRLGLNVVTDIGHHDAYAVPRGILGDCARRLAGLPVLFVGIRCPIEVIMARRNAGQAGREEQYAIGSQEEPVPGPVLLWQQSIHNPGLYDLELDTSLMSPLECAEAIGMRRGDPSAATSSRSASIRRPAAGSIPIKYRKQFPNILDAQPTERHLWTRTMPMRRPRTQE